ncbi:serine-type D-Ala-D-Ala carboxypeptidase [Pseudomonas sp. G5(2012)]|nr:D-alanyl-D-alanine carboxypeptidase family protein [Pseudomonas sp. G5(2012)]EPA96646.1 serine-type D-Ala-D-Ala carboxypeptidase [Pseudomonas sp. G5(2012)]
MKYLLSLLVLTMFCLMPVVLANPALAETHSPGTMIPAPPKLGAKAWILIDAATGSVITSHNSEMRLPPASLTKMMTAYVTTGEIKAGNLKADDSSTVSENAWRTGGSRMFLDPGSSVSVHDLLSGVIIDSGNDASVALAEHVAGSEAAFVGMMNSTASVLGMGNTHFMNSTGLPDPEHYSSARDMALLARAIISQGANSYALYSKKHFSWNGIRQANRNLLLWRDASFDGLKTGHTEAAGYCMVASSHRVGRRLISVIFGASSAHKRTAETEKLMGYGFRFFDTQTYKKAGEILTWSALWKGKERLIAVGLLDDLTLTLPKNENREVETRLKIDGPLEAPISAGTIVGKLDLYDAEQKLGSLPLIALEDGEPGVWWIRWWDSMHLFFYRTVLGWFDEPAIA